MTLRARLRKSLRDGVFALLGLAALGLAAYFWMHEPTEPPVTLRMSAGQAAGERHRIAEVLRHEAARHSITINLRPTAGSDEALRDVEARRLDAALAQGGLDLSDRPDLRQVATLHVEPLHLLVKEEFHDEVSEALSALRGKVVDLGERGSGTYCLATDVMTFAGLSPRDFQPSTMELRGAPAGVRSLQTAGRGLHGLDAPFFHRASSGDTPPLSARRLAFL